MIEEYKRIMIGLGYKWSKARQYRMSLSNQSDADIYTFYTKNNYFLRIKEYDNGGFDFSVICPRPMWDEVPFNTFEEALSYLEILYT